MILARFVNVRRLILALLLLGAAFSAYWLLPRDSSANDSPPGIEPEQLTGP